MTPDRDTQITRVAEIILAEGGGPGNSIHGWRCEYPERYGPCDCVQELAVLIVDGLAHLGDDIEKIIRGDPTTISGWPAEWEPRE